MIFPISDGRSNKPPSFNGIFSNLQNPEDLPQVTVIHSEPVLSTTVTSPMVPDGDLAGACRLLAQKPLEKLAICRIQHPGRYRQFLLDEKDAVLESEEVTTTLAAASRQISEHTCDQFGRMVPVFCRRDSALIQGCERRRQVIEIPDAYVVGYGHAYSAIFTTDGYALEVDPYKRKRALPTSTTTVAETLLKRAVDHDGITDIPSAVYAFNTYDSAIYHNWAEALPRLLHGLDHAPQGTPVLISSSSTLESILNSTRGLTSRSGGLIYSSDGARRAVDARRSRDRRSTRAEPLLRISRLFLSVETARRESGAWAIADEGMSTSCSWVLGSLTTAVRTELISWAATVRVGRPIGRRRILVVHRKESQRRRLNNHAELMRALAASSPPDVDVVEFIGAEHGLIESVALFRDSDLVILPHGAAMIFAHALASGTAVIELLFADDREYSYLTYDFLRLMSHKLGLRYGLVPTNGTTENGAKHELIVDVPTVVKLAGEMLSY